MLDIKFIRENPDIVKEGLRKKNVSFDVEALLAMDEQRRAQIKEVEDLRAKQNAASDAIARLSGSGRDEKIAGMKALKGELGNLEKGLAELEEEFAALLNQVPNLPSEDVPVGANEKENVVLRTWGETPKFDFEPKDHVAVGEILGLLDMERAAKVSGTRFGYLKNEAVRLEFALVQFAFDTLVKEGFTPVVPPVLIRKSITDALGYWQAGGNEDYYFVQEENVPDEEAHKGFYLVGTSEHSIAPLHKDELLRKEDLPKRYAAFSTCFRREAGSYGRDTRGIFRVHQFDKVEMVSFTAEEEGDREHEYLLSLEEKFFQALEIPHQVVKMCSAELGFPIARKYDIEAWFPGQKRYREVTSTSTTTDFQARRLNTRYQIGDEKKFVHILNGTAFAIGRTIIAILENYQQKDGSVAIPEALRPYMHGITEIRGERKDR